MSSELAIGLAGILVALIIGAVQIGLAWKRRESHASAVPSPSAQPLREEAVTTLMDVFTNAVQFRPNRSSLWEEVAVLEREHRELDKLRVRLRIARGITEEEVEAFTDAARMVQGLIEASVTFYGRRSDLENPSMADEELVEERRSMGLAIEDFQIAFARFEEAAKEAARR